MGNINENIGKMLLVIVLISLIGILVIDFGYDSQKEEVLSETITIANWNLQIFGDSKKPLIPNYAQKISEYDIIFIQEIRDIDGDSFELLCSQLPDYDCVLTQRAGRTQSKEQYGLIYKKYLQIGSFNDYTPDLQDRWERPPVFVTFTLENYNLTLVNIHVKPSDVKNELKHLERLDYENEHTIILGDLNADCNYYNPEIEPEFDSWIWLITDEMDTTVTSTNCAYDRIIASPSMAPYLVNPGVNTNVTLKESDHYIVWIKIKKN